MKVPFWRLALCFFGMHGPLEGIYKSRRHRESPCGPDKVQCLLCGRVMKYPFRRFLASLDLTTTERDCIV